MKTFMEEYGLVVVASIIIMIFMVVAAPVGKALSDGVLGTAKGFTEINDKALGEVKLNEAGFFFNQTYSVWSGGEAGVPLPRGENSFVFKDDGTVDHYIDGAYIQTLPYVADKNGFGIPALGGTTTGKNDGNYIYVPEYNKTLTKGPAIINDSDFKYTWNGNGTWEATYVGEGLPDLSKIKTEINGMQVQWKN